MANILVADNMESRKRTIEEILFAAGHNVITARNGFEALELFKKHSPELIIIDFNIPLIDCNELARRIYQHRRHIYIPIIFISPTYQNVISKMSSTEIEEYECLTLPVDNSELIFKVTSLLRKKRLYEELRSIRGVVKGSEVSFDNFYEGIWIIDSEAYTAFVNSRMAEILGYVKEEMIGRHLFSFMDEEGIKICKRYLERRRSGIKEQHEFEFVHKKGTKVHVLLAASPLIDSKGDYIGAIASVQDITERRQIEEALRESEEKWKSLVENTADIIVHTDIDGTIQYINKVFPGFSIEKIIGTKIYDYIQPECHKVVKECIDSVVRTGRCSNFEVAGIGPDGMTSLYSTRVVPIMKDDQPTTLSMIATDVTDRRHTENALKESEERFRTLFNQASDCILLLEPSNKNDLIIVDANDAACSMHGYTREELVGRPISFLNDPKCTRIVNEKIKMIMSGQPLIFEITHVRRDGSTFPVEVNARLITLNGKSYIQAISRDITDRKAAEEELRKHREHLMELVEERTYELQKANERLEREIFERKQAETLSNAANALLKLFPKKASREEYLDAVVQLIQSWCKCRCVGIRLLGENGDASYESYTGYSDEFWRSCVSIKRTPCICSRIITGTVEPYDRSFMTQAGSFYCNNTSKFFDSLSETEKTKSPRLCLNERFLSLAIIPIRYRGEIMGVIHLADEKEGMFLFNEIGLIEHMTPLIGEAVHKFNIENELRKNCEIQRETNELLEQMFSNIHVLIAYMDTDFNIIRVNRAFAMADEKEPEALIGKNYFDLYPDEENKKIFTKVKETGKPYFTYERPLQSAQHPERGITYWDWTLLPVKNAKGEVYSLLLTLLNVTNRKRAEAEAMRARHLASLGELAAGVAHEINNPINGIINYAQILVNRSKEDTKEHDIACRIIKESDRIASIVNSLLSFAHEIKEEKHPVNIGNLISETLSLSGAQLRKDGIKLKVDIPENLPSINAQPQQLEQVFLNIISNSRYALNKKYSSATENKILEISVKQELVNNYPYIQMIFYDNGTGIPANLLDKIMNPFFTTKPSGEGTGLGLSISHGIIMDHGGKIVFESVEGEFTKVIISLPIAQT
jgi:PAS domain S-box-containing protein